MSKTIDWEGITWTHIRTALAGAPCEGCENQHGAVQIYTALDPDGYRIYTHWCAECISVAEGEMAFKKAQGAK